MSSRLCLILKSWLVFIPSLFLESFFRQNNFKFLLPWKIVFFLITIYKEISRNLKMYIFYLGGTRWRSWLRHCATSRKVAGSISKEISRKLKMYIFYLGGTRWRSWLRHCVTSRKVAGSISKEISRKLKMCIFYLGGHEVAQLVETLRYKLAGRVFDSRWCHWNFSLT